MTFYNIWRTANGHDRTTLLERMKSEAPALASKAGFVSMTVRDCAADGRVLVEGQWQSKEAFEAAVADNLEAQRSRAFLEELGSSEPGLFTEVFRVNPAGSPKMLHQPVQAVISAESGVITFVQIWRMKSKAHQERWLETMHSRIGILTRQPGFLSMSLHTSLNGDRTAVYAQWINESALNAAINLPEAKLSHDEMARWGESDGLIYRVESVYLPYTHQEKA